jgi:hypothetical protein
MAKSQTLTQLIDSMEEGIVKAEFHEARSTPVGAHTETLALYRK